MGRKKKKQAAPSGPKGAPEWVVTFTDMVSLLVTFFVLMMTFSSLREDELLKMPSWMQNMAGIHEVRGTAPVSPELDQLSAIDLARGKPQPHSRPADQLDEDVAEMGREAAEDDVVLDLNDVAEGLLLEFGADECFEPGSTELPAKLVDSLRRVGEVLSHYPHMIVVEGFTDDRARATKAHPSPESLALARALEAVRVLRDAGVNPLQLQVAGQGPRDPRSTNATPEGRRLNRRVQVRVLALSKSRAAALAGTPPRESR